MFNETFIVVSEKWNPGEFSLEDAFSGMYMIGLEMIRSKETQLNGMRFVADCTGFSFKQARQFSPRVVRTFVDMIVVS
jgi:hypothetical protein